MIGSILHSRCLPARLIACRSPHSYFVSPGLKSLQLSLYIPEKMLKKQKKGEWIRAIEAVRQKIPPPPKKKKR